MHDDRPVYGASPAQAVRLFWTRYATFTGRASRSEFWWWSLVATLVSVMLEVVRFVVVGGAVTSWWADYWSGDPTGISGLPDNLWAAAILVPTLAQTARRLHDTNRSGWWQAVAVVPVVGWVLLLVWCIRRPDPRGSRYDSVGVGPLARPTSCPPSSES